MKKWLSSIILVFVIQQLTAGEVDSISVFSVSMQKEVKCVIIKPTGSDRQDKRLPVVYLLHGYGGNQRQWINLAPQLKSKVDELQMLIVCPDGGIGSWYLDSPIDSNFRYETFVSRELVNYVDSHYKTIADRQHRAVTGLSMGGHGGLYLAIRNRNVYAHAGSTSGGVDIRPFPNNWDLKKRLGDTVSFRQNWEKHTVINLVDSLKNKELKLIIDCGLDDFFLTVNRNLHNKLMQLKIEHDYIERPGAHNNAYWRNSIDYQLLFFAKAFG